MTPTAEIGLIGLGTMGQNLALNIADNGFQIAVYNRTTATTTAFVEQAGALAAKLIPTETLEGFVANLSHPRKIILMVPAGAPVDAQIEALRPLLAPGDLIIDGGNSDWHDTNRRAANAAPLNFLGLGVSGGSEGARYGPSMMAGGPVAAYDAVAPILRAIAADYHGTPCVAHLGPDGAGHYVKMIHNGIEYADMQMIAEVYGVMRDGMGLQAPDMAPIFARWNDGTLQSYLIEITAKIARSVDVGTGAPVLDVIKDSAGQKGTGRWTVIEAHERATPIPAIEAAVVARILSSQFDARAAGQDLFGPAPTALTTGALSEGVLEQALIAGKIIAYTQGFNLLAQASAEEGWNLALPQVAEIWREGCIIRSAMLNDMAAALADAPTRPLIMAPHFADLMRACLPALRQTVSVGAAHGLAMPALASALAYVDTMRTARGTANMLQAQRDFFGAHGFERLDRPGETGHHGPWGGGR
jgi:6-phosphogluconate dehydrogenase